MHGEGDPTPEMNVRRSERLLPSPGTYVFLLFSLEEGQKSEDAC